MPVRTPFVSGKVLRSQERRLSMLAWVVAIACLLLYVGKILLDHYERSALYEASECGDNARLRMLLRLGVDPNLVVHSDEYPGYEQCPLILAASNGQWSTVHLLLNAGAKTDFQDAGYSALEYALRGKNLAAVKELLKHGADPNRHTSGNSPVLGVAVEDGDAPIVAALLDAGADPNGCYGMGAASHRLDIVKLLVEHGANVNLRGPDIKHVFREGGYTPLMVAALSGNKEITQFLLAHGASPNVKCTPFDASRYISETPLSLAVKATRGRFAGDPARQEKERKKRMEIVDLLRRVRQFGPKAARMEENMSVRTPFVSGKVLRSQERRLSMLAWVVAIACLLLYVGKILLDHYERSALYEASERGDNARVRMLLRLGADPNSVPINEHYGAMPEESPLVLAVRNDKLSTVHLLLNAGATADFKGWGDTALVYAVRQRNLTAVKELLEHHANPNRLTRFQVSILADALLEGETPIIVALLDAGADPNGCRNSGLGAAYNRLDLVKLLVAHGADVNLRAQVMQMPRFREGGYTPLMMSVVSGNKEITQFLLAHGASPNVKWTPIYPSHDPGETPLSVAVQAMRGRFAGDPARQAKERKKRMEIVDLLRQAGAKE